MAATQKIPLQSLYIFSMLGICPHEDPNLETWSPEHSEENRVTIEGGQKFLLTSSVTVHSIHITNGGKSAILQRISIQESIPKGIYFSRKCEFIHLFI